MTNNVTKIPANRPCIIKGEFEIFRLLKHRFAMLNIHDTEIIKDAEDCGQIITKSALSRYLNSFDKVTGKVKPGNVAMLSQEKILWLCERYGIIVSIDLKMKKPSAIPYCIDNKI